MHIADALSRAYLQEQTEQLLEEDLEVNLLTAQHLPISEEKLSQFKTATAVDDELQLVIEAVQSGWPEQVSQVPAEIKKYWTFREDLCCSEGLVFKNSRLIVPQKLRAEMLQKIHEAQRTTSVP